MSQISITSLNVITDILQRVSVWKSDGCYWWLYRYSLVLTMSWQVIFEKVGKVVLCNGTTSVLFLEQRLQSPFGKKNMCFRTIKNDTDDIFFYNSFACSVPGCNSNEAVSIRATSSFSINFTKSMVLTDTYVRNGTVVTSTCKSGYRRRTVGNPDKHTVTCNTGSWVKNLDSDRVRPDCQTRELWQVCTR